MVRLARFSADDFVAAATALVAEGGPAAATISAIARRAGAPTGSVYHRFDSRAAVLATAWLQAHGRFCARVLPPLAAGDTLAAALSVIGWARAEPASARFLLLNEIEALVEAPPRALHDAITRQRRALEEAFAAGLARFALPPGCPPRERAARARFLVFDAPLAALRPHLLARTPVPRFVDSMVRELHGDGGQGGGRAGGARRRPMRAPAAVIEPAGQLA